jgi:hypothetical protein
MFKRIWARRRWWWAMALTAALLLAMPAALAQGPDGTAPAGQSPQYWGGWDWTEGGGALKVLVRYTADYPGTSSDLPNAAANASGLYNYLVSRGWLGRSIWGNQNSWEGDWKKQSLGGWENSYGWQGIDTADLVFYEGHGNPSLFTFNTPWGNGTMTDNYVYASDAYMAWGDLDAEWIALLSCSVLADNPSSGFQNQTAWAWAMNHLHLLMGFKTTAYDVGGFGPRFATYIDNSTRNFNLTASWFKACDDRQPNGVVAKVMAEEYNHFFDTKDYQYPDWWDNDYYVWTHACGGRYGAGPNFSGMSAQADVQYVAEMPVFKTPPLDLATEATPLWNKLSGAFSVPATKFTVQADGNYWTSDQGGRQLQMDVDNGLFTYVDTNQFYTPTAGVAIQAAMDVTGAQATADAFLQGNGLMPTDAHPNQVAQDTVAGVTQPGRAMGVMGLGPAVVEAITLTNYTVIYERVLSVTSGLQAATAQYSVVGPGGKLQVNVSPTGAGGARVAAAGANGAVIGAQGGWRRISDTIAVQAVLPVLPPTTIAALFQQLEPQVALAQVPFENPTSKAILSSTLSYWEEPSGTGQDQLYPAYALYAQYNGVQDSLPVTVTDWTYIPANAKYMRPFAKVESSSDQGRNYATGQTITATAADASKPLDQLGFSTPLTFTLGSGGSYSYLWYLGSVAPANLIGSGRNLSYQFPSGIGAGHGSMSPQTILLKVTDSSTAHTSQNSSTYSISFNVAPPVFLPLVVKGN